MGHKREQRRLLARTVSSLAIASALIALAPAYSAESTWTGGTGDWNSVGNWSSGIPGAATSVSIDKSPSLSSVVNLNATSAIGTMSIDAGDSLNVLNTFRLDLNGNATINGNLNLQATSGLADLRAMSDRTLDGTGTLTLGNSASNRIYTLDGSQRITIGSPGSSFKLQGAGDVGVNLARFTNFVTVEANQVTPLLIKPSVQFTDAFINQGTLRAVNGATLQLTASTYTNTGGLIQAQSDSIVDLGSAVTIVGGTLSSSGTGQVRASGTVTLENVTQSGLLNIQNGRRIDLKGTLTNNGTVHFNTGGELTDFRILGDATISGNGTIVLADSANHRVYAQVASQRLTLGSGQTLRGAGNLGTDLSKVTNEGTIIADRATALTIDVANFTDGFFNRGSIQVHQNSTLMVVAGAGFIQDTANASTKVLGTMNVPTFQLQAGTLGGTGTIAGLVLNTGGAVSPGESPGTMNISGNYTQGQNASLLIELNGTGQGLTHDLLQVTGNAELDGTLDLQFGFTPAVGASFVVLTTGSGVVTGTFDSILKPAGWDITANYNLKDVTLTIAAVPESETYLLMLTGLGLIAWAVKRRQRRIHASWPSQT